MTTLIRHTSTATRWPYSLSQLRLDEPARSFSDRPSAADLAHYDVFTVAPTAPPSYDPATQRIEEVAPTQADGTWQQQWAIVPLTPDEQAAYYRATHPPQWVEFAAIVQTLPEINQLLAAALQASPALAMALAVGLGKAVDGDYRVFLQAWSTAYSSGLVSTELVAALQEYSQEHDLPLEFTTAINPAGTILPQRARNADGTFRADDPNTPDVDEAWA